MIGNDLVLGVIPAREGSKRLPMKALRTCAGKPLIQWTIEFGQEAKAQGLLDGLVVTTDSPAIRLVASALGCDSILRPAVLATDECPSLPVVRHARLQLPQYVWICLLQPTSPVRRLDLLRGLEAAVESTGLLRAWTARPGGGPDGGLYLQHADATTLPLSESGHPQDAVVLPANHIDIDTAEDLLAAEEALLR